MCQDQLKSATALSIFLNLHNLNDSSVSRKLTDVIRGFLPADYHVEIKNGYSVKSLRKGAVTQMAMHPVLNAMDMCSRSGHNTGTTLDSYLDNNNIAQGQCGGKVLNNYINLKMIMKVLRLEALGAIASPSVDNFILLLSQTGELNVILNTLTASLIIYHKKVTHELAQHNSVATKDASCSYKCKHF